MCKNFHTILKFVEEVENEECNILPTFSIGQNLHKQFRLVEPVREILSFKNWKGKIFSHQSGVRNSRLLIQHHPLSLKYLFLPLSLNNGFLTSPVI